MNRAKAVWTMPVSAIRTDHRATHTAAIRVRGRRSARLLMGTDPSRKRTPPAPAMAPITASLAPSVSWMSGLSTATAALSKPTSAPASPMVMTVVQPPMRSASRSGISSPPTPGRRSSGRTTGGVGARAASRRDSSSRTAAASPRSSASPPVTRWARSGRRLDRFLVVDGQVLARLRRELGQEHRVPGVVLVRPNGPRDALQGRHGLQAFDGLDERRLGDRVLDGPPSRHGRRAGRCS